MIRLVQALLIHRWEFLASPCSCTGNQQVCKHRNNNQQTQMVKAGSHILDKVKRVSGRRVKIRMAADIRGQRGGGAGACGEGTVRSLLCSDCNPPSPQGSPMMRKQSEHKISTAEPGCFGPRTIPIYPAGSVIKGVCP